MELSTNNGGSSDNYAQVCFTATATTLIEGLGTSDAPITGEYLPESPWEDIHGADMNGVWTLQVSDDSNGFAGTLNSWSITLPPVYAIDYFWEPANGVSDPTLPNVDLSPDATTTYTITASDTYGCTTMDEVTITVDSLVSTVFPNIMDKPYLEVYPSLASEFITIHHHSDGDTEIRIVGIDGRILQQYSRDKQAGSIFTLGIADIPVGVNFIQLITANGAVITKKFVKK